MNGWVLEMPKSSEVLGAGAAIIGRGGAALASSKSERRLRVENERLKDSLLCWRILAALFAVTGAWGWLT